MGTAAIFPDVPDVPGDTPGGPARTSLPDQPELMEFGTIHVEHDPRVLRPRPWTRLQSEWAAELARDLPAGPVLELCTGAGQIGLLTTVLCGRPLVAVDADPVACGLARRNAVRAGVADLVEVRAGDMRAVVGDAEEYALVVADPPWVTTAEVGRYPEDPLLAIDGGEDGLAVARLCLGVAADHLLPGGLLLVQLGDDAQAEALAAAAGWVERGRRHGERGLVLLLARA